MSSLAQIVANRANALLSTGPQSSAGVAATKYNATRHGLSGQQIVVKGEDPAVYDALRAELLKDSAPSNEREAMLVEEIAQHFWRHQRALRVEAQVLEKYDPIQCVADSEARKAFTLITRYVNGIQRSLDRARRELDRLQKARKKSEAEAPLPIIYNINSRFVSKLRPPLSNRKIGFVSQKLNKRHPNEDLPLACRL